MRSAQVLLLFLFGSQRRLFTKVESIWTPQEAATALNQSFSNYFIIWCLFSQFSFLGLLFSPPQFSPKPIWSQQNTNMQHKCCQHPLLTCCNYIHAQSTHSISMNTIMVKFFHTSLQLLYNWTILCGYCSVATSSTMTPNLISILHTFSMFALIKGIDFGSSCW